MTRKEYVGMFKIYGLALLCVLPVLIALNLLLDGMVSYWVMVLIDCVVIVVAAMLALKIKDKRNARIQQKRAEFEAQQKANSKGNK